MVLTSAEVYATLTDERKLAKPQQHGVDLTIDDLKSLHWDADTGVYVDKTKPMTEISMQPNHHGDRVGWDLIPGYYAVYFDQGVKIPADCRANIVHRSSLGRSGAQIFSGEYDPGYETKSMGAFLIVHSPLFIEKHARIAQIIMTRIGGEVELYNGQWQHGKNQ